MLLIRAQFICLAIGSGAVTSNGGCGFPRPADVPAAGGPDGQGSDAMVNDARSTARCDPNKPFGTPTVLSTLNSSFDEASFALSRDELLAFIGRENIINSPTTISVAMRTSVTEAFGSPAVLPVVAAINSADGDEHDPSLIGDTLVLYFHRQIVASGSIGIYAAVRADTQSAYDAGSLVFADGAELTNALSPVIASDGQTLYWLDFQNFRLHSAQRMETPLAFGPASLASTIPIHDPVLSRDQLTIYYNNGTATDILASTRTSKTEAFGTGIPVANINSAQMDAPVYLTDDGCILYLSSTRSGGNGGFDLWEARRPL
jgi:hypothetical protein